MYNDTLDKCNNYTQDINPIDSDTLKCILEIVLNQTFFQFNNTTYKQNYGITMGAPSSVKIANITLYLHLKSIQTNYSGILPSHCFRLIDDIFGIWLDTEDNLLKWFQYLNSSHSTIKFTLDYSYKQIPFLDTLVYLEQNIVKTRLYKKPTDKKQFLEYSSEHPQYMKNATPYSQALRYRRITTDNLILEADLNNLKQSFISRGYPSSVVNTQVDRVLSLNRTDLIKYKSIKDLNNPLNFTPFVLTFSNVFNNNSKNSIYKTVSLIWSELTRMAPILKGINPPKIIFKKGASISNLVESSVYPPKWWNNNTNATVYRNDASDIRNNALEVKRNTYKCKPCNGKKCQTCDLISTNSNFRSTTYNKTIPIQTDCNCDTKDIIYLITCTKCNIQYVGESGQKLRDRINNHKSTIRTGKLTPIAIHFNSNDHSIENLSVNIIETFNTNNLMHRRTREYYWQLRLGTIYPKGLNNFPVTNKELVVNKNIHSTIDFELLDILLSLERNN